DVLGGYVPLEFSHAGGEFQQMLFDDEDSTDHFMYRGSSIDHRTCWDHVENRNEAFSCQLDEMMDAFMAWQ
ncbi:hypothetical protein P691DRAFT_608654, partial [Macrolepiota fuliginosa MF-IS2]